MSQDKMKEFVGYAVSGNYEDFSKALTSVIEQRCKQHEIQVQYDNDIDVIAKQRDAFSQITNTTGD